MYLTLIRKSFVSKLVGADVLENGEMYPTRIPSSFLHVELPKWIASYFLVATLT